MAAFEVKPETGSLFKAEKSKPDDRDYSGQANIGGELHWVSGWVAETKAGKKYLKLRFKPQVEKAAPGPKRSYQEDLDDQIPF